MFNTESDRVQGRVMVPTQGTIEADLQRLSLMRSDTGGEDQEDRQILTWRNNWKRFELWTWGAGPILM